MHLEMLQLTTPNAPHLGVPGDVLSPWAPYLARPARHWRRWCRACSPPHTGTCLSPPGSAWRIASLRPALLPGPVQKIRTTGWGLMGWMQWRLGCLEGAPVCPVLSRATWNPRTHRFPWPPRTSAPGSQRGR